MNQQYAKLGVIFNIIFSLAVGSSGGGVLIYLYLTFRVLASMNSNSTDLGIYDEYSTKIMPVIILKVSLLVFIILTLWCGGLHFPTNFILAVKSNSTLEWILLDWGISILAYYSLATLCWGLISTPFSMLMIWGEAEDLSKEIADNQRAVTNK